MKPKQYMGGCQNDGPFWDPLNTRCRIILRTKKGTIALTTTHIMNLHLYLHLYLYPLCYGLPKRDRNFDNHPYTFFPGSTQQLRALPEARRQPPGKQVKKLHLKDAWDGKREIERRTHTQRNTYTFFFIYIHVYIHMLFLLFIYLFVYMCWFICDYLFIERDRYE